MGTKSYVIRSGVEGRKRLRLLAEVMGANTRALLAEVGIPPGSICLDVGCGGGDVTLELGRATGPAGRAIGVDFDKTKLEIARRECAEQGVSNVTFEALDVTAWKPGELFDVVYARFLLTHLPNPGEMVSVLRQHTNPGGVMIVEDTDFRGHFAEPDCPALQRSVELYTAAVQNRGADPNIGPKLPGLLRDAGFADIQMRLVQPAALLGGIKLLICVTLEHIAEAVLDDHLTTEAELRKTIDELYEFASNPHTVMGGPRVFQVWGRNQA